MIRVVHHERSPAQRGYSLERAFSTVRRHLGPGFDVRVDVVPRPSSGLVARLLNMAHVARQASDVHHVTGDVHYLTLALPRSRTVLTVADCGGMHRLKGYRRWIFRLLWLDLPVRASTIVTTISEATRRELSAFSGRPEDRIRVIGCPVPAGFAPAARRPWPDRPSLLHVGTTPNKNLPRVARALSGLPCRLVVLGRCDAESEAALRSAGVDWVGLQDITDAEMPALYAQSDLVLFASTYEGFGMPIIEAQATGRPVVTSGVTAMPQVAGAGACLVDPFDAESIRSGVLRVKGDAGYRDALVRLGFENVQRFAAEGIAAQYARLYEEVFDHAGPVRS